MCVVDSFDGVKPELIILRWNPVIFLLEIMDALLELLDKG